MEVLEELDDPDVGAGDRDFVVVQRLGEAVADHGDVGAAGEGAALRRRARAVVRVEADLVGGGLDRARDARRRRDDDGVRAADAFGDAQVMRVSLEVMTGSRLPAVAPAPVAPGSCPECRRWTGSGPARPGRWT